jgi:hypothetical protein
MYWVLISENVEVWLQSEYESVLMLIFAIVLILKSLILFSYIELQKIYVFDIFWLAMKARSGH